MKRLTGKEVRSMMEALNQVYAQPEVEQLDENRRGAAAQANRKRAEEEERIARVQAQNQVRQRLGSGRGIELRGATGSQVQGTGYATRLGGQEGIIVKGDAGALRSRQPVNVAGRTLYPARRGNDIIYLPSPDAPKANSLTLKPGSGDNKGGDGDGTPLAKLPPGGGGEGGGGSNTTPPTAAAKPTASSAKTYKVGDKQMSSAQIKAEYDRLSKSDPEAAKAFGAKAFAAANPKIAAANAERARIRGTNQTTNPLMKDVRSRLPDPKTAQSPTLAKDLGKSSGNQALLNNPNVPKVANPANTTASTMQAAGNIAADSPTDKLAQGAAQTAQGVNTSMNVNPAGGSTVNRAFNASPAAATGTLAPAARPAAAIGTLAPAARPAAAIGTLAPPAAGTPRPGTSAPATGSAATTPRPSTPAPAARPARGPVGRDEMVAANIKRARTKSAVATPVRPATQSAQGVNTSARPTAAPTLGARPPAAAQPATRSEPLFGPGSAGYGAKRQQPATRKQPLWNSADLFDIVKGELLDEGYSEEDAMYIMANLDDEQREIVMNEGIGSLLKGAVKIGKKLLGKGPKKSTSSMAKRAGKVVKDQRAGFAGTDDALNVAQKDLEKSMSRLRRQERRGGRGAAALNARSVERDVKRAAAYGPQTSSSKPFGQRIDPPKPTGGKPGAVKLTPEQEERRRDIAKALYKIGTPGYPGPNDPATRKLQAEFIRLQKMNKGK